jgi:hypothetical protein
MFNIISFQSAFLSCELAESEQPDLHSVNKGEMKAETRNMRINKSKEGK